MQPITLDFTDIIWTVVTSGNGMVALALLVMMLGYTVDIISKRGLQGIFDDKLNETYDSYISYLDKKKYSKETLEVYDPIDDNSSLYEYEDRLATYRKRKELGLPGISEMSDFSFSDSGHSGAHREHYSISSLESIRQRAEEEKYNKYSLDNESIEDNSVPFVDDNGMDVYLTWEEIEKYSAVVEDKDTLPINNDDYIPLIDGNSIDLIGDIGGDYLYGLGDDFPVNDGEPLNIDFDEIYKYQERAEIELDLFGSTQSVIGSDLISDNFKEEDNNNDDGMW